MNLRQDHKQSEESSR